ncbi:hypothetical protein L218DRAFT_1082358 [Marasmius fiardii PR-910]|nr:hypothetical protein L218DRAFT_1082358 [Marasmius fiardii PR-910]
MTPSVLIVGAGPTGLVLALTLLRNGVSVRIIEKNEAVPIGQRGAGIMPRTLEMYKFLHILLEVEAKCENTFTFLMYASPEGDKPVKKMTILDKEGEKLQYLRVNARLLGQDEHQTLLAQIIEKDYPGTRVEFSTELTTFEQHEDHVVAHLYNRKNDRTELTKIAFVVGADGAHSLVRKKLGLTFLGETYDENALVVGDAELTKGYNPDHMRSWGHMGDKMLVFRCYQRDGKDFGWFFMGGPNVDIVRTVNDREYLMQEIHSIIGKKCIEFGEIKSLQSWRANVRMVNKFGEGRVFVTGDAGHVHSPTGGQGLNSGVQDSINLGWKLALVQKGLASPSLLDTYTTERIPVIAAILNKTTELMNTTFSKLQTKPGGWGWANESDIRQFGINYRRSSIVLDERYTDSNESVDPYRSGNDESVHAGDRAPNAPGLIGGDGLPKIDLFDFLDVKSHTIVVFEASSGSAMREKVEEVVSESLYPPGLVKVVTIYPKGTELPSLSSRKDALAFVDGEGHAMEFYKVKEGEEIVVVVRPDGYIGAVIRKSESVNEYFRRIFIGS